MAVEDHEGGKQNVRFRTSFSPSRLLPVLAALATAGVLSATLAGSWLTAGVIAAFGAGLAWQTHRDWRSASGEVAAALIALQGQSPFFYGHGTPREANARSRARLGRRRRMSGRKTPINLAADYRHASRYFLRQWRGLAGLVALCFVASGLAVVQPWPLKLLVDTVFGSEAPPAWLGFAGNDAGALIVVAAIACFLAYGLTSLVDVAMTYGWMRAGQRMVYDVAADLYDKLQARSLAHRHERPLGDSLNRLFGDSWSLYTISYTLLTVPLQHSVTIVAIGIVAWSTDATLTLIAVGVVPFATLASYVLAHWLRRLALNEARLTSEVMAFVQQTLSVIPLIQTFSATSHTQKVYRGLAERGVDIAGRAALVNQGVLLVGGLTVAAATSAVLVVGGLKVLSGEITLGVLVVFLAYLKTINHSVEACLTAMAKVIAANAGLPARV